ncbi:MAG: T9SS type A sorting domain-containing protein [Bacteroidota bacterium]
MKKGFYHVFFSCIALLGWNANVLAQVVEFGPIDRNPWIQHSPNQPLARQSNTATLPFWDDFSKGIQASKWITKGVSYTESIGNRPPSLGMVVFNGVDSEGSPYSVQAKDQGEADFLTSLPIDLTLSYSSSQQSTYLSFFWQAGGKAEAPDSNDQFLLQILDAQGTWITIWQKQGGSELDRTRFFQEIIHIKPEWQHASFQFRFFSSGRRSGPFDAWLLDYVYLNTRRNATDLSYPDRAITQVSTLRLGEFGAYPWELLEKNQTGKWTPVRSEFQNLENRFKAMEYSITLRDSTGNTLLPINATTPFNPVPNALERRSIVSRTFTEIPLPKQAGDLFVETSLITGDGLLFEINASDTVRYPQVDFRDNDRVSTRFALRDYFAYDQGVADYAAGVNQKAGQLAVQYTSPESVFLKGISIDFTNAKQINQVIDLKVWSDLSKKPLYSKEVVIQAKKQGESIHYFPLEQALPITGTFYVGYTQFTNDFLQVGLDKSNDRGDRIYYNVGGGWQQNKEIKGALLIRPHISKTGKASGEVIPENTLRIYPNPVVQEVMVEGKFTKLQVMDAFGREVILPRSSQANGEKLNFTGQLPGLYFLYVQGESGTSTYRIIVSN